MDHPALEGVVVEQKDHPSGIASIHAGRLGSSAHGKAQAEYQRTGGNFLENFPDVYNLLYSVPFLPLPSTTISPWISAGLRKKVTAKEATKQLQRTTKKRHTHQRGGVQSWQVALRGQCDSLSLNNTNQALQILIFAVINFIQTSSRLTGFVWESSGNLMCL